MYISGNIYATANSKMSVAGLVRTCYSNVSNINSDLFISTTTGTMEFSSMLVVLAAAPDNLKLLYTRIVLKTRYLTFVDQVLHCAVVGIMAHNDNRVEFLDIALFGMQFVAKKLKFSSFIIGQASFGVKMRNIIIDDNRDGFDIPDFNDVSSNVPIVFPC